MKRRDIVALLAGLAAALPLAAHAQQAGAPTVGFLSAQSQAAAEPLVAAFRKGLDESGQAGVAIEVRAADDTGGKLAGMASDLIARKVALIAASGTPATRAAKAASETVPLVFTTASDPVKLGIVLTLNRPRKNATGVVLLTTALEAKRLELLREVGTRPRTIAFLVSPGDADAEAQLVELQAAARAIGQRIVVFEASKDGDIAPAIKRAVEQKAGALIVANDTFFDARRERLVSLVAQHRLPAIYPSRAYVAAGGLMSYATSLAEAHRQAGVFAGRILKGEKAGAIRVASASAFELAVNRKTAQAMGLPLPPAFVLRADEVIE